MGLPYYNQQSGKLVLELEPSIPSHCIQKVILFQDTLPLSCLAVIDQSGIPINAAFNQIIEGRNSPYVDAVTLAYGRRGDAVPVAITQGERYRAEVLLPNGTDFYLGMDCLIKGTAPLVGQGANWRVKIGRRVNDYDFIFDPQDPVSLSGSIVDLATMVTLGPGSWSTNQPFRIINGITHPITSIDATVPICHGVLLESGVQNQIVPAITTVSHLVPTPLALPGNDGDILWLPKTPTSLTNIQPSFANGDIWMLDIASRSAQNALVYSPGIQIKLC